MTLTAVFLHSGVQKLLNDPTLMQHIHNVSVLKSDQLCPDMQDSEAMRKHHLEQQQEQFNKEIGQVDTQFFIQFLLNIGVGVD